MDNESSSSNNNNSKWRLKRISVHLTTLTPGKIYIPMCALKGPIVQSDCPLISILGLFALAMIGVLNRGWLTKSPPEKKLGSHIKLFRAKWKKRYFVLTKKDNCHDLSYYKDSTCQNKKGSINLEECTEVTRVDQVGCFPHLLAVKTMSKNKPRTYFLAAQKDYEVDTWIHWLNLVCGHKNEEDKASKEYLEYNPTPIATSPTPITHSPEAKGEDIKRTSRKEDSPLDGIIPSEGKPEYAPCFQDFIKYLNDSLSFADNDDIVDLSTVEVTTDHSPGSKADSGETSKEGEAGEDSLNSTLNSSSNDDTEIRDQSEATGNRVVSDYDVPRSTRVKVSPDLPPPASHRPKLLIHTYVNTGPMSHLVNPEIDINTVN
ncbi:GRB2-associated-binding protein 3 [Bulinus truncatus]|nr:GRB2-associated-binding protein 3 [Bulinus truncatus]